MSQRLRNFVFTLNNWTEDERVLLSQTIPYKYLIYGREKGEKGTNHLQGYCVLRTQRRFEAIKKMIPRAHIEGRKGTHEQAKKYCMKEGDFVELGEFNQGDRTDLDETRERCTEEKPMREITTVSSYQQINIALKYLSYNETKRDFKPNVIWIYGPSGSGKSRMARTLVTNDDVYTKNDDSKWWDGYDAHENVIIDDFRGSWWKVTEMLSLLDRYEKRVEVKGGFRQFKPKTIIITSIRPPQEEYTFGKNEPCQQLLRRIDKIIQIDSEVKVSEVGGSTMPLLEGEALTWV